MEEVARSHQVNVASGTASSRHALGTKIATFLLLGLKGVRLIKLCYRSFDGHILGLVSSFRCRLLNFSVALLSGDLVHSTGSYLFERQDFCVPIGT